MIVLIHIEKCGLSKLSSRLIWDFTHNLGHLSTVMLCSFPWSNALCECVPAPVSGSSCAGELQGGKQGHKSTLCTRSYLPGPALPPLHSHHCRLRCLLSHVGDVFALSQSLATKKPPRSCHSLPFKDFKQAAHPLESMRGCLLAQPFSRMVPDLTLGV